jgi:hypothetical protein
MLIDSQIGIVIGNGSVYVQRVGIRVIVAGETLCQQKPGFISGLA